MITLYRHLNKIIKLGAVLAWAQIKMVYEGRFLGMVWFLISPLFTLLLLFFIFVNIFSSPIGHGVNHYPLYLLVGIIMYNFFRQATVDSVRVFYNYRYLLKSLSFEYSALIISVILKTLLMHIIELGVLAMFVLYFHLSLIGILYYMGLLLFFVIFVFGLNLIFSSGAIFILDLENIWGAAVHIIWFITPIFYDVRQNVILSSINKINPMYYFVESGRELIIYGHLPSFSLSIGALLSATVFLCIGGIIINLVKKDFPEYL